MTRRQRTTSFRVAAVAAIVLAAGYAQPWRLLAQAVQAQPQPPELARGVRFARISQADMQSWLTTLASDAFQGRQAFTEGYGMAAAYVAEQLKAAGVKPMGDNGSYFQVVARKGYRVTRNSSVTVETNGQTRTFKHGEGVTFNANSGGTQSVTFDAPVFVGTNPDFNTQRPSGKLAVWVPATTPAGAAPAPAGRGGRGGGNRGAMAMAAGAAAAVGFQPTVTPSPAEAALASAQAALTQATDAVTQAQAQLQGRGRGRQGGRGAQPAAVPDINPTTARVDAIVPPQFTADERFFEFLFSGQTTKFPDLRARAERGELVPPMTLAGAKVTVNVDNTFQALSAEYSKNVVGIVEGSDPQLKDTYVFFGAHLDHTGVRSPGGGRGGGGGAQPAPAVTDLINNGADDDGSGSTALLGIAKAFATGPKPKRSVVFVWHTAEESGLLGSRYMADNPVVPLEKIQAQLNMDMIGRSHDDKPEYENTVFVVGADRISTDLHNLVVLANQAQQRPLKLDFEFNDPAPATDNRLNNIYGRSDHFSYAAKGIPIAFFFTGLHADYHQPSDHVEKINFPKLTRISQLVYELGFSVAHSEHELVRDNKGPRAVKGSAAEVIRK